MYRLRDTLIPVGIIFLGWIALVILAWVHDNRVAVDDTDLDAAHRSGANLITDYRTCLQYLSPAYGGITPRLDTTGKHMLATACAAALKGE